MPRATLLLALVIAAVPGSAHAFMLGADLYGAWLVNASERAGPGVNIRLGEAFDLSAAELTIEVGGTFMGLGSGEDDLDGDVLYAGFGGARLSIGAVIQPGVYAHVGYAAYDHPVLVVDGEEADVVVAESGSGPYANGGLFLDFTALPILSVGVDASYNFFLTGDFSEDADNPAWFTAGVHAALTF